MAPFIHKSNEHRQRQATLDLKLIGIDWYLKFFDKLPNDITNNSSNEKVFDHVYFIGYNIGISGTNREKAQARDY